LALYRIYQQALANIVRHAQADHIVVRFSSEDGHAVLEVQDNGRGFTVPANWRGEYPLATRTGSKESFAK
jgi:signal transduction histidine kinase